MDALDGYGAFFPSRLRFGWDVRKEIPQLADELCGGVSRVLWVTSGSVYRGGPAQELKALLGERVVDVVVGIPHDPPVECVDEVIRHIRRAGATMVLATGGGSVLDVAKTAALLACAEAGTTTHEFLFGEKPLPTRSLPVIGVPTTAGTGAEVTKNSVLTDAQRDVKQSMRSPAMIPAVALIDPEFTLGLPFTVTRDSGLDALTQAIESCTSTGASRLSRSLAHEAVALLMAHLESACRDERLGRERVAEGSMLGGLAFSQSGLGAVHGLAHPLGHVLNVSHGLSCAILLPHILRWNLPVARDEYEDLGRLTGLGDAEAFVEGVSALCGRLGVPHGFRDMGLSEGHFGYIVAHCRSGSMKVNPRPMSDEDVEKILMNLL